MRRTARDQRFRSQPAAALAGGMPGFLWAYTRLQHDQLPSALYLHSKVLQRTANFSQPHSSTENSFDKHLIASFGLSLQSPGAPLATKDGGWDVYCLGCAEAVAAESWRLTRKADFVYATLLLANDTLPMTSNLSLPFVVNVPGGVDGSWPLHTLASVTLLGAGSTSFKWSEAAGLVLSIQPGATAPSPFAAVFKLDYSVAL